MHFLDTEDLITFEQPILWKVLMIIESEPPNSGLRQVFFSLGSFHTEMSFIGSIGYLMAESGLKKLLELIYTQLLLSAILLRKPSERAV